MSDAAARRYPLATAFLLMATTAARDPNRPADYAPPDYYALDLDNAFEALKRRKKK